MQKQNENAAEPIVMTVRDFISKLQQFSPDLPILVSGYEWGYETPKEIRQCRVSKDEYSDGGSCGGPWDFDNSGISMDAVIIFRKS